MNILMRFNHWIDERAPGLQGMVRKHVTEYYAPKNFNLWYYFGTCNLLVLVNQILTGIFLAMNYTPTAAGAFDSVEYIMRDVEWGWLIRYMHSTGASLFFVSVYLHMFRAIMYGSFKRPRELVWILGMVVFLALMAEAFLGYVLPWGQMSFWGAKVIISLFGTVPVIGDTLVEWIMGDYLPSDATLNRFFALHVVALPLALVLLVVLHILALHEVGSNNPDGVEIKKGPKGNRWDASKPADGIPFHPYYTVHDIFAASFFVMVGAFIVFFGPTFGGWLLEHDNFVRANNLATPAHIKPVWYFTPFYAILRMVPSFFGTAIWGVLAMFAAIALLALLPWIDRGGVRSVRYRGAGFRVALIVLVCSFLGLGLVGAGVTAQVIPAWFPGAEVTTWENAFGRLMVLGYFGFFAFLWIYTRFGFEKPKPVPQRVSSHS
ncbi:cytochrome b [Frateuria hangzhouensis]|uniref:cytochrome b n=1 Tax=Frateuria hangzhouensis TaxID=2995589 RepID=UPI002260BD53|nr:cytochrome bc complex cytochrome b subunit [Frateuria sp. STR12]MCX7512255.1 cytochrome bc complex cytochrome b subunit [Frateuria sp. STR12]